MKNLFFIFFCLISELLLAQNIKNYTFSTDQNSALVDMSAGTNELIGTEKWLFSSDVTPLGFEFWFMGKRYTDFSVNCNGVLRFGKTKLIETGNSYSIAGNARLCLLGSTTRDEPSQNGSGFWKTSATGKVHYKIIGNAPNRKLVVEWKNLAINHVSKTEDATFQAILHETSPNTQNQTGGKIEMIYGKMNAAFAITNVRIGIGDGDFADRQAINLDTNPLTSRIVTETNDPPFAFAAGIINILNTKGENACRRFVFTPPNPNGVAQNLDFKCENSNIVLSWANSANNAVGSVLYVSSDGKNYSFMTQIQALTLTQANSQNLCFKVYAVTEGNLSELQTSGQICLTSSVGAQRKFSICEGKSVELSGQNDMTYEWFLKGISISKEQKIEAKEAGTYILESKNAKNCSIKDTFEVSIFSSDLIKITNQTSGGSCTSLGKTVLIADIPSNEKLTYQWQDEAGNNLASDSVLAVETAGLYKVLVSNSFCSASKSTNVSISTSVCCPAVIEVPNAFTPHNTPSNNVFQIKHENLVSYEIQIYNRWGILVFFSQDPEQGWEGNFQGSPAAADVYQVVIKYQSCNKGIVANKTYLTDLHLLE
ncbi:MAG: gliding motility-associated C-terminal domain-containing protein [Bacteroidetes bacterium]|nr:MAG: gliding motility-associated C-terminal domain-containing protein [Bacteroidota bacterium]